MLQFTKETKKTANLGTRFSKFCMKTRSAKTKEPFFFFKKCHKDLFISFVTEICLLFFEKKLKVDRIKRKI